MSCPVCEAVNSVVIDTRANGTRRRECTNCRHRWTTVEVPAARKAALERVEKAVRAAAGELSS
jgi:transcriptional regulator NrdR family protein